MGNNRGSPFSLGHVEYTKDQQEYWNFYQEEMGTIDIPTFLDFILGKTGLETLSYVGHSQGTTQMFMGLSLMPEYFKERVNLFVALEPPVYLAGLPDGTKRLASFWREIQFVMERIHFYDFVYFSAQFETLFNTVCTFTGSLCRSLLDKHGMLIKDVDNMSRESVMYAHFP